MDTSGIVNFLKTAGVDLLRGLLVLGVGFFLIHWLTKLIDNNERFKRIEPTLRGFLRNLIRILLYVVVILTASSVMGIPMTSILTLVASCGVAVSLALQGVLTNMIGGVILLILKPIRAGEFVKIGDYEGTVQTVGAFYTEMTTFDNRHISLPNGTLTNTAIINYTREGTRRLDITFSVDYGSDLDKVYEILNGLIAKEENILPDPAPAVVLSKCAESSLDFSVRVWVKNEHYWPVNFRMVEQGKRALDRAGISIPFPQLDVHIK